MQYHANGHSFEHLRDEFDQELPAGGGFLLDWRYICIKRATISPTRYGSLVMMMDTFEVICFELGGALPET